MIGPAPVVGVLVHQAGRVVGVRGPGQCVPYLMGNGVPEHLVRIILIDDFVLVGYHR